MFLLAILWLTEVLHSNLVTGKKHTTCCMLQLFQSDQKDYGHFFTALDDKWQSEHADLIIMTTGLKVKLCLIIMSLG